MRIHSLLWNSENDSLSDEEQRFPNVGIQLILHCSSVRLPYKGFFMYLMVIEFDIDSSTWRKSRDTQEESGPLVKINTGYGSTLSSLPSEFL